MDEFRHDIDFLKITKENVNPYSQLVRNAKMTLNEFFCVF